MTTMGRGNITNHILLVSLLYGNTSIFPLRWEKHRYALPEPIEITATCFQEIGAGPQRPPPASKEVVANLPVVTVTDEVLARLGSETQCAVCRENLAIGDKMQELPCKHLFHPPCLKPWLVGFSCVLLFFLCSFALIRHDRIQLAGRA